MERRSDHLLNSTLLLCRRSPESSRMSHGQARSIPEALRVALRGACRRVRVWAMACWRAGWRFRPCGAGRRWVYD